MLSWTKEFQSTGTKKKKKSFQQMSSSPPNLMTCIILSSVNQNYQCQPSPPEGVDKQFLGKERKQQKMEATQLSLANRGGGG